MTQACADCRTENRDGAKFCKGCGRRLQALRPTPPGPPAGGEEDWPATQQLNRAAELPASPAIPKSRAPSQAERQADEEALAAVPAFRSEREFARPIQRRHSASAPRSRTGGRHPLRRVVVGLLAVALLGSAAVWYFSQPAPAPGPVLASVSPPPPVAPAVSASEAAAPGATAALAPSSGTAGTAGTAAMLDPTPRTADAEPPSAASKVEAAPTPARPSAARIRKPAPPPPPAPVVVAQEAAPEPPAPAPPPPPPPTPQAQCAGMNFIARAQCMATQCSRPEMRAHAQCEAVRRQQQIEEEKRNPTLLN